MFPCSEVLVASADELYDSGAGKMLNNKINAESVGKLQPRPGSPRGQPAWGGSVCFETLGQKWRNRFFANLKELRRVLRLPNRDATPSELRLREMNAPRIAKAQPWAGISERFQRW